MLAPEEAAVLLEPYLLETGAPLPRLSVHGRLAMPPSILAYRYSPGREPFAVLRAIEQDGVALQIYQSISPGGPLFSHGRVDVDIGLPAAFLVCLMRSEAEAQAFVEEQVLSVDRDEFMVTPIADGPQLGDAAYWFRCDRPGRAPDTDHRSSNHGDHVRWRRGLIAFDLIVSEPPLINLAGVSQLAQTLDARMPPDRLTGLPPETVQAPATEEERLHALLRAERLLAEPALDQVAFRSSSLGTHTAADYVLQSTNPAAELRRVALFWQRVSEMEIGFHLEPTPTPFSRANTHFTATVIEAASAEGALRNLHDLASDADAPPIAIPNSLTFGDATVMWQTQRARGGGLVWQNQAVGWLHSRVLLVAKVSGLTKSADWTALPRFAQGLEAAYQDSAR